MILNVCFKTFRLVFLSVRQKFPIRGKMRNSRKTFGTLALLCCLFLTECRVLKFVVAVSLPPFVSMRLIHGAVIRAPSHQMTVVLLRIVADYTRFFHSLSIVTFTHLRHKGLLWASNTASHISDRHFVHKPLCISLSVTLFQQWKYSKMRFEDLRPKQQMLPSIEVSFHSGCLSLAHITQMTSHYVVTGIFNSTSTVVWKCCYGY